VDSSVHVFKLVFVASVHDLVVVQIQPDGGHERNHAKTYS